MFTESEMRQQVLAIAQNHKTVTVRGVKSITNFPASFIEKVLFGFVEDGLLKTSPSYTLDGEKVNERVFRVKKKFIQASLFGDTQELEEEDD